MYECTNAQSVQQLYGPVYVQKSINTKEYVLRYICTSKEQKDVQKCTIQKKKEEKRSLIFEKMFI